MMRPLFGLRVSIFKVEKVIMERRKREREGEGRRGGEVLELTESTHAGGGFGEVT